MSEIIENNNTETTTSSSSNKNPNEDEENEILYKKLSNLNKNNDDESKQQQKIITGINGDLDTNVVVDNNKKKKKKNKIKTTGSMDVTIPTTSNDSSSSLNPEPSTSTTTPAPITASALKTISNKTQKDLNELEKNQKKIENIRRTLDMLKLKSATMGLGNNLNQPPKSREDALEKKYEFWETQPVPKLTESDDIVKDKNEPIHPPMQPEEIPQDSLKLPDGFQWVSLDIDQNEDELKELYTLLYENYVEDDDNMFRFNYSPEFLRWVLQPPGWRTDWYAGVRVKKPDGKKGKLVGFISAIPTKIRVYDKELDTVEINFLCVHKKLRSKRMAPVLISEITRRVRLQGIFQALYTAGVFLPKPIASCRYYHRSLNPKKLIDVGFSHLTRNMTMSRTIKLYKVPEKTSLEGLRRMKREDVEQVHQLLTEHMKKFDLVPLFTLEEIAHWLLPIENVIETYVVENKQTKKICGFFSYYILPSTVMNHKQYKDIRAAYSFYNVPSEHCSLEQLMSDALIIAKNSDLDVFNALDQRDNDQFLTKLKFGRGDGDLHYYLFNWKCPPMKSEKVGVVLQ